MNKDPYRLTAHWYDRIFEPINIGLRLLGLRMFRPKEGMSILDVGCGTGTYLDLYSRYKCNLFGIDASPSMLEIAKQRLGDSAKLFLGSAVELPYEDDSFDLVVMMLTLHEMDQAIRLATLGEIGRVLKNTGRLLLIDFHPGPIQSISGWRTKAIIFLSEIAAGRDHFRNYRNFMSIKGIPKIIEGTRWSIEKQNIVGGGPLGLYLLHQNGGENE